MKNLKIIVVVLLFVSACTTPKHLTLPHGVYDSRNKEDKVDVNVKYFEVKPLTNKDDPNQLPNFKNSFKSYYQLNDAIIKLSKKYPDLYTDVQIHIKQNIYRTWILDIFFFYPMSGYWPITPWWVKTSVDVKLFLKIPKVDQAKFTFSDTRVLTIITYPYYKAGRKISEHLQRQYTDLFSEIRSYEFCDNWSGKQDICKGFDFYGESQDEKFIEKGNKDKYDYLNNLTLEQLKLLKEDAVKNENYELAAIITEKIKQKESKIN